MIKRVWKYIQLGWRVVAEAHTILWLLERLGIVLLPAGVITAALRVYGEHSAAILAICFAFLSVVIFVGFLAWLGHRREVTANILPGLPEAVGSEIEAITERRYEMASDAIAYLISESEWAERVRASPPNAAGLRQHPRYIAVDEFVRAARDGEILVFGRLRRTGEHQPISQQYWLHASIDPQSAFGAAHSAVTIPTSRNWQEREEFTPYDGLCVDRAELFRVWPKAGEN